MNSRFKIALLCDWFFPRWGGIEQHLLDLAHELQKRGHTVGIITSTPGPGEMEGVPVFRLSGFRFPYFGFVCSLSPFRDLKRILRQEHFDLVHVHTSYIAPLAWGGAYIGQGMGLPTLVTFHSKLAWFSHVLRWADLLMHWSRWRVKYSAVSEAVRDELQGMFEDSLGLLPNGTDVSFWKSGAPERGPWPGLTLVSVMRFGPRKRGAGLVRLFARLRSGLPADAPPLRLVLIGDGRLRWQIQLIISRLKLKQVVALKGYLPRSEIRRAFAQADIFILPSEIESFGLSALEARSTGLPVVVHQRGGARSFIHHGVEGLLADSDEGLVTCLRRLTLDEELRRSIAIHNRLTRPDYDWPDVIRVHEQAYREAVQEYAGHRTG